VGGTIILTTGPRELRREAPDSGPGAELGQYLALVTTLNGKKVSLTTTKERRIVCICDLCSMKQALLSLTGVAHQNTSMPARLSNTIYLSYHHLNMKILQN
jgi:hypothetical protein